MKRRVVCAVCLALFVCVAVAGGLFPQGDAFARWQILVTASAASGMEPEVVYPKAAFVFPIESRAMQRVLYSGNVAFRVTRVGQDDIDIKLNHDAYWVGDARDATSRFTLAPGESVRVSPAQFDFSEDYEFSLLPREETLPTGPQPAYEVERVILLQPAPQPQGGFTVYDLAANATWLRFSLKPEALSAQTFTAVATGGALPAAEALTPVAGHHYSSWDYLENELNFVRFLELPQAQPTLAAQGARTVSAQVGGKWHTVSDGPDSDLTEYQARMFDAMYKQLLWNMDESRMEGECPPHLCRGWQAGDGEDATDKPLYFFQGDGTFLFTAGADAAADDTLQYSDGTWRYNSETASVELTVQRQIVREQGQLVKYDTVSDEQAAPMLSLPLQILPSESWYSRILLGETVFHGVYRNPYELQALWDTPEA